MNSGEGQPQSAAWPTLGVNERRVLGVLVEKAKTTPDAYPLSVNALVMGCNQKSNRDPVLELAEADVKEALGALQQKGLSVKITGGRVERWRHALYEAWKVDKVELAVLAELLLRGPQTEGELRGRASRMEPIADLELLRTVLRRLAERALVAYLSPEGRRGIAVTHGFHSPEEMAGVRSGRAAPAESRESSRGRAAPEWEGRLAAVEAAVAALRDQVQELRQMLAAAADQPDAPAADQRGVVSNPD